jgi:hypothetical protein
MNGQDRPVVKVYVRKGHDADHRRITFLIPNTMTHSELFEHGFAIDGNQAVIGVPVAGDELLRVERQIVEALDRHGRKVEFA